jgi:hypothetical protein
MNSVSFAMTMPCAFACAASAETVYNVSGSLGDGGLLSGGSFSGTFTANLPVTGGGETISTFNINLFVNSDPFPAFTFTGSTPGDTANVSQLSGCGISATTAGPCDAFDFAFTVNGSPIDGLQLVTPIGFYGRPRLSLFNSSRGDGRIVRAGSQPLCDPRCLRPDRPSDGGAGARHVRAPRAGVPGWVLDQAETALRLGLAAS